VKFEDWPNCPTPDCQFKVCMWAGTGLCAKCSEARIGKGEMDRRYADTHDDDGLKPDIEGIEEPADV